MTRSMLACCDLFAWLVRLLGGDYPQFRAILETKLTLDSRRPMVGFANQKTRDAGNAFLGALVFYALIGFLFGGILFQVGSPLVGMTIVHSVILVMLATTLIADFTNVLLDTTDNSIVQPRPVSGRTLFLARTTHICIYLGLLGLSLSLVTMVVGTLRWSYLFALVYLPTLAGGILLAVSTASVFYLIALRITDRERVRDIIVYIQILLSVFIFAGYQFLPRLVDFAQMRAVRIDDRWWIYVFPPAWLAGPVDLLTGEIGRPQITLTLLAIAGPLLAMLLVTRGLATRFHQMLAAMEATVERQAAPAAVTPGRSWAARLAALTSRRPEARAGFEFIWTILSRDRLFKSRMYPSLAILLIVPLSMLLTDRRGLRVVFEELPHTHRHLFLLYLACITFPSAIIQLRFSPHWQAAWIYESLPLRRPGEVLMAAVMVLILRLVLPAFAVISAVLLAIWGWRILPDVVLALLATVALALGQGILLGRHLPFSQQVSVREGSGRLGKNLLLIAIAGGLGGLHYLLLAWPGGVVGAVIGTAGAIVFLARIYRATSWSALGVGSAAQPA